MYRRGVGRPLKFRDPTALRKAVDEYFDSLVVYNYVEGVDPATQQPRRRLQRQFLSPPTISGLAVALDTDRGTLLRYLSGEQLWDDESILPECKMQLSDTIRYAHAKVEEYGHEALFTAKSAVGPVFSLKNNHPDWEDVSTVKTQHSIEQADLSKLSDDELQTYMRLKEKTLQGAQGAIEEKPSAGLLLQDAGLKAVEERKAIEAKEEDNVT